MSDTRQDFLQTTGTEILAGGESRFAADPAALGELDASDTIIPLTPYGLLAIEGPDAEKFLQGQITCSAADVTPTLSSLGAYCTPKGRVVASFQLIRLGADRFAMRMRADILDSTAKTFGKYIVFSKAKMQPDDSLIGIGLHGANAAAVVRGFAGGIPGAVNATLPHAGGFILQRDDGDTWFECWLPPAEAAQLWAHAATATPTGSRYWHWLNIRAGTAEISAATTETYIPQMLNYHLNGAVNFKKGCYTGQEIVARAYYRGQVKRHLIRAALAQEAPAAGTEIADANGRAIGSVVAGVTVAPGRAELLAVCSGDHAHPVETLHIAGANLEPLPLPYAIP